MANVLLLIIRLLYVTDKVLYDQKLKYAAVVAPLAVKDIRLTVNEGITLMNHWENFTSDAVSHLPTGLKGGWQYATNWVLSRQKVVRVS
jgi:hypothetical protein